MQEKTRQTTREARRASELPIAREELTPVTLGPVAGRGGLTKYGMCWHDDDNSKAGGTWCG